MNKKIIYTLAVIGFFSVAILVGVHFGDANKTDCITEIIGYYNESGSFINETLNFPVGVSVVAETNCKAYWDEVENIPYNLTWYNYSEPSPLTGRKS